MRVFYTISGMVLGVVLAAPGFAQSVTQLGGPAETPPASYSSDQYVDSRGCVFIRAGYGGNETWVPRVTRSRQALCGYQPSGGSATAAAPAPTPAPSTPARPPVTIAVAPVAPARPVAPQQPTVVIRQAPVQAVAPAAPVTTRPNGCPGLPASAGQFMQGTGVRCGPQAIHPGDAARGMVNPASAAPVQIPQGYRAAWTDGRLNPHRGLAVATPQGDASMARYWTDSVPMEAIDLSVVIVADAAPVSPPTVVTRASSTPTLVAPAAAQAAPEPIRVNSTHRYVEIARYSDRTAATGAQSRLMGQGVATRLGGIERADGSTTLVVLAGPFDNPQTLGRTLQAALGMGYSAAVTRR